ncbi:hypothetical protein Trydic_g309 [Trypoxylus dichotomus]
MQQCWIRWSTAKWAYPADRLLFLAFLLNLLSRTISRYSILLLQLIFVLATMIFRCRSRKFQLNAIVFVLFGVDLKASDVQKLLDFNQMCSIIWV